MVIKMADEKEIKRVYNVPLRKGWLKAPRWNRTKKAVKTLKKFLARHMKVEIENVYIGKHLNERLWQDGIKRPPHHVKLTVIKDKDGMVKAELEGFDYKDEKKEKKEEKSALGKAVDKITGADKKKGHKESKKEEQKENAKPAKKEEVSEDNPLKGAKIEEPKEHNKKV